MESNESKENVVQTMNVSTMIKGLIELGSLQIDNFELNMTITDATTKLGIAEKSYIKTIGVLMKKHIEVNDKGVFLTEGEGQYKSYVYKSVKDKETYLEEMVKLNNKQVDSVKPGIIKMSELKNVPGLKAYTMIKLGVLVHNDLKK